MRKYLLFLWLALLTVQMKSQQTISIEFSNGATNTYKNITSMQFVNSSSVENSDNNSVFIQLKDGYRLDLSLSSHPIVTFGLNDITISTDDSSNIYTIMDVLGFYFNIEDAYTNDIEIKETPTVKFVGENIYIEGLSIDEVMRAFSLDGKLLLTARANSDGCVKIVSPAQAMILKSESITIKLIKR